MTASDGGGTYVVTTALPSRTADRELRTRRYVLSQALRSCCFLAAALLPLPVPGRLALVAVSIALPWGAVVAANAGPARVRRRVDVLRVEGPPPTARHESRWYRLRWRLSYALLQAYGPAQLSGESDPRRRMLAERSARARALPASQAPQGAAALHRPPAPTSAG